MALADLLLLRILPMKGLLRPVLIDWHRRCSKPSWAPGDQISCRCSPIAGEPPAKIPRGLL